MYCEPVGVDVLTNGNRCEYLRVCIDSFLKNCYARPLVIGIFDNGSTDDTSEYLKSLPKVYGVTWRVERSPVDLGCARGTNAATDLVKDTEYAIHLESDFIHLTEAESGVNKMWLHDALSFMEKGECDFLYLRRMINEYDMQMHWWSQWMPKVTREAGPYLKCPGFWWSNNPALRRVKALYSSGTLPLDVAKDGQKGQAGWSQPELQAPHPTKPWIYRWGMFKHECLKAEYPELTGCKRYGPFGTSTCKYGFYKPAKDGFCLLCDPHRGLQDMNEHEKRYRSMR